MPGVYKITEIVGTSPVSFAEAVKAGVAEAGRTLAAWTGSKSAKCVAASRTEKLRNSK